MLDANAKAPDDRLATENIVPLLAPSGDKVTTSRSVTTCPHLVLSRGQLGYIDLHYLLRMDVKYEPAF